MSRNNGRFSGWLWGICLTLASVCLTLGPLEANAASPLKVKAKSSAKTEQTLDLPAELTDAGIDAFMAQLSDDQVRRVLIDQLKRQAQTESRDAAPQEKPTLFINAVGGVRNLILAVGKRMEDISSGRPIQLRSLPAFWQTLYDGTSFNSFSRVLGTILGLFLIGLAGAVGLNALVGGRRRMIASTDPSESWPLKTWRISLNFLLDLLVVIGFLIVTLAVFIGFLDKSDLHRLIYCAFLVAFALAAGTWLVSRSTLMPHLDNLRFLPLDNELAGFLHRGVLLVIGAAAVTNFITSLLIIKQIPEKQFILISQTINLIIIALVIYLLTAKRQEIGQMLGRNLPEDSFGQRMARNWHWLGVAYVLLVWLAVSIVSILGGIRMGMAGIAALLSVPLFFILDWIVQSAFGVLMGRIRPAQQNVHKARELESPSETAALERPAEKPDRFYIVFRRTLRFLVAISILIWLLGVWGLDLALGRVIAKGGISIIVTVLIGYVIWELINAPIERRLKQELSGHDEDMEEGGAGGSRLGTLLLLLRKFIFSSLVIVMTLIALSAIGVNVGPLIAGAGIFGLAIGFGAQALVKDIISGIFFLVDDAFRVGDYIETGSIKGMVEKISLRSMQIRHPRGMVHTVHFGDMGSVTNFSRDYIITKLTFRVTYDTDIEKVRKIIKTMYKEFLKDPELGPKLLGKLKSQGVRELDDSAMIMRVKFKTAPGEQFMLRREIFRRLQEEFKKNGIQFAHRNVTVYIPDNQSDGKDSQKMAEAGAAAALASEQT